MIGLKFIETVKLIIFCILIILLTSCGAYKSDSKYSDCQYESQELCLELEHIKNTLKNLETQFNNNVILIDTMSISIAVLENLINNLQLNDQFLQEQIEALQQQVGAQQSIQNLLQQNIAELEGNENIVEFIDPCGDGSGYDEILLKTSSNKLIAYFEQGGNRFLSILNPGNYRTTDSQRCNFSVTLEGTITNEYL